MSKRDKFLQHDSSVLRALIQEIGLAILVAPHEGHLRSVHLPLMLEEVEGTEGLIRGHMARANPLWKAFDGRTEALVIWSGADAYVSPTWYRRKDRVPTWNYAAVHAWGLPKLVSS